MKKIGIKQETINVLTMISLLLFVLLTIGVEWHIKFFQRIDLWTFHWWFQHFGEPQMNFSSGWQNSYFTFFAQYFDVVTIVALTLLSACVFAFRKYYALALWLPIVVGSGGVIGMIFKDVIHRPRPYDHLLIDSGFSFPSGHSLASSLWFIIVIFILLPHVKEKYRSYAVVLGALCIMTWLSILISRLYFHAHFLTDILGGLSLSLFWVMVAVRIYVDLLEPFVSRYVPSAKKFNMIKK